MSKNSKTMRRNINKVLRLVVAAFIATSLGAMGMAVAQTVQDASCPNHTEHDDTCGYVAAAEEIPCDMDCETASGGVIAHAEGCAYTAATAGSDCAHSCELCDPEGAAETAESAKESEDSGESEQQALITTLSNGDTGETAYEIKISNEFISDSQSTMNLATETTGTLVVSVSLPEGETGRYLDIYLPDYGMAFSSTLPSVDENLTSVEKLTREVTVGGVSNTVEYLRIGIANTVNTTLNISVSYVTSVISDELDALWGETGTLSATGFEVVLYNGDDDELNSATYGSWVPENVDTDDAFVVGSGYNSYITNYPDLPSVYSDTSHNKNGRWYMSITARSLYNTSYEVRRENLESIKIYVPDPDTAVVVSITSSSSDFGLESFDAEKIQKDEEGYYYELDSSTLNSYRTGTSTMSFYIYVVLKKAENSEAKSGESLGTYRMVLTTRTYGEQTHTYEASYTPQMKTETVVSDDAIYEENMGYYAYRYYGGDGTPATTDESSPSVAHTIEPGTEGVSDTMAEYQVSGIVNWYYSTVYASYINSITAGTRYVDYVFPTLEGSTEEWEFPYEIQPTRLTYYLAAGNYLNTNESFATVMGQLGLSVSDIDKVLEVTYETSEGGTYTAKLSLSDDSNYLYIDFDQFESDERVTSVTMKWLQWVEYRTSFSVTLTYNVPSSDENGDALVGGTMYQVKHQWYDADENIIVDSTDAAGSSSSSSSQYTHIWFMVKQEYCPQLIWSGGTSSNSALDGVIMSDTDTYTNLGTLEVNESHSNADDYMNTVTNPKIKLGVSLSAYNDNALAGWGDDIQTTSMFLTGKMTVMPFLAGWTVTYTTANTEGDQCYTIPDDIPEEGLEIQIPINEGDRFTSVLVFSYEGSVSGWKGCPELIKNVEYAYYRTDASGESVIKDATNSSMADRYVIGGSLYGYFCSDSCTGTDGSHRGVSDDIYSVSTSTHTYALEYLNDFVYNVVVMIGSLASSYSSVSVDDVYQGGDTPLSITLRNAISLGGNSNSRGWSSYSGYAESSLIKILNKYYGMSGVNGYYTNTDKRAMFPYESSPTFYVELLTDDVTYMFEAATAAFGYPSTTSYATVEFVQGSDGSTWLKITPDEEALAAAPDYRSTATGYPFYITWALDTLLYALPGAETGTYDVIGDIYLDLHVQELEARFDGTDETYPYLVYEFDGLVADELGLLGDDDTTTERLYKLEGATSTTVGLYTISGVNLYPGTISNGYDETYARTVDVYNHDADGLLARVSIATDETEQTNYKVTVHIPREGESVTGTQYESADDAAGSEATMTSEFTMWLTGPVTLHNSQAEGVTITYQIGNDTYTESDVEDWSKVEAVIVNIEKLPALAVLTLTLSMAMDAKDASMDGKAAYIGATYSYYNGAAYTDDSRTVLGQYVFHTYKLSGVVWYDPNENGTRDTSEEGTEEITKGITLTVKQSENDEVVATTQTDESGAFSFELVEGEGLYIEIELPDGYKLTARSSETNMTTNAADSDFNRNTNILTLPAVLRNGTYTNISAGLVKLPVITAPNISVTVEGTAAARASAQWDYADLGLGTATLHYEQAEDTEIATVAASDGTVTGVEEGETTATVWMVNTLGDRVEAEYTILVGITAPVSFTLIKNLTEAADADETFVFQITDSDGNSFYATLTVAEGETTASTKVVDLTPGEYTVRELDTNWRYTNIGDVEQTETLEDANTEYSFTFTNKKTSSQWVSGSAKVINTMGEVSSTS